MNKAKIENYEYSGEELMEKYQEFWQFLTDFAIVPEDYPGISDLGIIIKHVNAWLTNKTAIPQCLKEGREVLALKPFPWEWIRSSANGIGVYTPEEAKVYSKEELAIRWVTEILDTLEAEAKKQGKLDLSKKDYGTTI